MTRQKLLNRTKKSKQENKTKKDLRIIRNEIAKKK